MSHYELNGDFPISNIMGCAVVETCGACPEQYDVFKGKVRIGYLRLRWGHFRAHYPTVGGEIVYERNLGDNWQGVFTEQQRSEHLPAAVAALLAKHKEDK